MAAALVAAVNATRVCDNKAPFPACTSSFGELQSLQQAADQADVELAQQQANLLALVTADDVGDMPSTAARDAAMVAFAAAVDALTAVIEARDLPRWQQNIASQLLTINATRQALGNALGNETLGALVALPLADSR